MTYINFLWLCIWSGMFSDTDKLNSPDLLTNPFAFIQGIRSLMPIIACVGCVFLLLGTRSKLILYKNTLGFLFLYCSIGLLSSVFMSPRTVWALYWAGSYLAPLLVVWIAQQQERPLDSLRKIININYFIVFLLFLSLMPQIIDMVRGRAPFTQFFDLPFELGQIRVNGVGRYALIVGIVAFVRMNFAKRKLKIFWVFFVGMALVMMAYTRSRTTLLGLAAASLLFAYIQKADWRIFLAGPVSAYVLWISGYKWRAQQHVETLLNLTGREFTWQRGLNEVLRSPIFGWGFQADRFLLRSEHMHNSYLHAAIQSGFLGAIFFLAGILYLWALIIRSGLLKKIKYLKSEDKPYLLESILIAGFFTARSFFESTAAFYGVDLLVFLPAAGYIIFWLYENPNFHTASP